MSTANGETFMTSMTHLDTTNKKSYLHVNVNHLQ